MKMCSCGCTVFVDIKFGGDSFNLQTMDKISFFKFSGFKPEFKACVKCKKIEMFVPGNVKLVGESAV